MGVECVIVRKENEDGLVGEDSCLEVLFES
jgi:hypothetical protein